MRTLRVLLFVLAALPLSAGLITVVGDAASSRYVFPGVWDLQEIHLIDGSGLSGSPAGHAIVERLPAAQNSWQTASGTTSMIVFNLGAVYDLSKVHIWNFNFPGFLTRDADQVDIQGSSDSSSWNPITGNAASSRYNFSMASGSAGDLGFDLPGVSDWNSYQYIRFQINTNHGDPSYVGLSEVQFFTGDGDEGSVPEPSTIALLASGFGCLGLVAVRRRRRG